MQLHFEHLNLRYNPFGTLDYKKWSASIIGNGKDYLPYIGKKKTVLFLGSEGVGKTSHMLSLQRHFDNPVYVRLPEFSTLTAFETIKIPDVPVLLLDECQRLLPWQFPFVFRKDRTVVLCSHRNHSFALSLLGWKTKIIRISQDNSLKVHQILQHKIELSRRTSREIPQISIQHVEYFRRKYGSIIRSMEHELYEIFQNATSITDVYRELDLRVHEHNNEMNLNS